jgi:hypothetical protein
LAQSVCAEKVPELRDMGGGHLAACHFGAPFPIPV